MRCDCGANMVRRWTRRTTGKADRDRGTGATEPRRRRAQGRSLGGPARERKTPTRPEREGGDSQGPRIAPYVPERGLQETATFEQIVWDSPVSFDRARVREPLSPHWLASSRTSSSAVPSAS
jgi:hypothetical protein